MKISVVLPVFNEQENLPELYQRLQRVLKDVAEDYEIIMVDDGSTDGSWQVISSLHQTDPRVKGLRFTRNFGHHIALTAGLDMAKGDLVAMMDADLQDAPEELPKLLNKIEEGYFLVYGIRGKRNDPFLKRVSGRVFWRWINLLGRVDIPENQTMLRVMRREVADALRNMREVHRFIHGLMAWTGFPWTSVEVEHRPRAKGKSKYNFRRMIGLALNASTSFSTLPLRLSTYLGLAIAGLSILLGIAVLLRKIIWGIPVMGYASTMVAILFTGSVVLLVLGVMGEYLGKLYMQSLNRPLYFIREKTDD